MEKSKQLDGDKKNMAKKYNTVKNDSVSSELSKSDFNIAKTVNNIKDTTDQGSKLGANDCESENELKVQLNILMNSIATLSAEKSRMEANFQADRKQLRAERDENEKVIKDLRDKLKRARHNAHSDVEHVKYKLIMERHERDKNQADNSAMIKELQILIANERRAKESLEQQLKELKSQVVNKTQNKVLEAELEIANNKLKQAEAVVKETPPVLLSLQAELATLREQHKTSIHEERKRVTVAEQKAKALEAAHETRVAGLEARLAELSETVGGYDRLRHQDQHAIQKLKEQLSTLQKSEYREHMETNYMQDPTKILAKTKELYVELMEMNKMENLSIDIKDLFKGLKLYDTEEDLEYRKKYNALQQEFDNYKQQMTIKLESMAKNYPINNKKSDNTTELQLIKSHCNNMEEKIRMLNKEISRREKELDIKLKQQSQLFQEEKTSFERLLSQKEMEFRGKIGGLEHQLLRQRERSFILIEEKNQEILSLKSSLRSILMKNDTDSHFINDKSCSMAENKIKPSADYLNAFTSNNPPLLHYAQELARKEIQVTALRKQNSELENTVRENQRDFLTINQHHMDKINDYEIKVTRLEAYKSREGANLEYLKNVLVNYLTSTDTSNKRHMLNAIATVLKFTNEEIEGIQRVN